MEIESNENNINWQVKDILKITGQNEVIQSFVRSDVSHDSEEVSRENMKQLNREKKHSISSWKISDDVARSNKIEKKNKERRENSYTKQNAVQSYQQLGKDAKGSPKAIRKKSKSGGRWNRRQRLIEEVYTDKDRAAAVNLGSRDIKQSLKLKRRQDRTRILEISEEAHPGTLLALATHRFKAGDICVALRLVDKALELNPYDKNALVARSKCHLLIGNTELALADAEQALAENKSFIKGLYQKAEALYHLAQFEYSLMYFHKGLHIRPQLENFKQGVHKAQQAIINTVGKTVPSFEKLLPRKRNVDSQLLSNEESSTREEKNCKSKPSDDIKLLKKLHTDKKYLEILLRNPDIICVNDDTRMDHKIFDETKDGIEFLENRQHFWRQQQALTRVKGARSSKQKHNASRGQITKSDVCDRAAIPLT